MWPDYHIIQLDSNYKIKNDDLLGAIDLVLTHPKREGVAQMQAHYKKKRLLGVQKYSKTYERTEHTIQCPVWVFPVSRMT